MTDLWKILMLGLFFTACAATPQQGYSSPESYQEKASQDGAHEGHRKGRRKGKHGPPPQALQACEDIAAGTACSFEGRRGAIAGTCKIGRSKQMVCRPEGGRMRKHRSQ